MKNVKVESKKLRKATKPRCVAGVQVRSGVKAGFRELGEPGGPELGGPGGPGGERPGLPFRRWG